MTRLPHIFIPFWIKSSDHIQAKGQTWAILLIPELFSPSPFNILSCAVLQPSFDGVRRIFGLGFRFLISADFFIYTWHPLGQLHPFHVQQRHPWVEVATSHPPLPFLFVVPFYICRTSLQISNNWQCHKGPKNCMISCELWNCLIKKHIKV